PHGAFFHLLGDCRLGDAKLAGTAITLDRCSGFVLNGPVFRFDLKAAANLAVQHCMLPRYNNMLVSRSEPDLILQADTTPISFQGKPEPVEFGSKTCCSGDLAAPRAARQHLAQNDMPHDPEYQGNEPNVANTLETALTLLEMADTLLLKPGKASREIKITPTRI